MFRRLFCLALEPKLCVTSALCVVVGVVWSSTSECNLLSSDRFAIFPARFPVLISWDDLNHHLLQNAGLVACRFVFCDVFMGFIGKEIQQDGDHTCLSEVICVTIFQIRDVFFHCLYLASMSSSDCAISGLLTQFRAMWQLSKLMPCNMDVCQQFALCVLSKLIASCSSSTNCCPTPACFNSHDLQRLEDFPPNFDSRVGHVRRKAFSGLPVCKKEVCNMHAHALRKGTGAYGHFCPSPLHDAPSVYPTPRGHRQRDWALPQARARSSYHAQRNLSPPSSD